MRFAAELGQVPVGAMARHISGAYALHLRRRRGWIGGIFNHYAAIPVDADLFLDDLVIWLHRPPEATPPASNLTTPCWTADSAYRVPHSLPWIAIERVLKALSPGGAGRSAYLRRRNQPLTPKIVALLTAHPAPRRQSPPDERGRTAARAIARKPLDIEEIARFVADYSRISYEDMRSPTRRRVVTRAKVVTAVLAARHGASVAAVARLFGRSRSTLSERAKCYRETQPQLFAQAECALGAYAAAAADVHVPGIRAAQVPIRSFAAR